MTKSPEWDEYLFGFAVHAAKKAKPSTKVGAALVDVDGSVLITGFNGPPRGVKDTPDRTDGENRYLYCAHAEQNVISTAAKKGIVTDRKMLFTTHFPCSRCAQMIIQAGIAKVYFGDGKTKMPEAEFTVSQDMFNEAGVIVAGPYGTVASVSQEEGQNV